MSNALADIPSPDNAATKSSRVPTTLPELKQLAGASFVACLPVIGVALVLNFAKFAIGIAAGYLVCLVLYAFLRTFVTKGMDLIVANSRGTADRSGDGLSKAKFAAVSIGKFFVIGSLMYVLMAVLKANVFGFVTGFLLSQAAITVATLTRLNRTPRF